MDTKTIGDTITVRVNGREIKGVVRFATPTFISIDEGGGSTAILKHDPNGNMWRLGKFEAKFEVEPFGKRLERILEMARSL